MRSIALLGVVMLVAGACNKDTGAQGQAGAEGEVTVPNDLLGIYAVADKPDHKLTIGPMGMKSSGIICSQNLSFTSFASAGDNKWKFTGDDTNGIIVRTGDSLNVSVGGDGLYGCHAEGLTGIFSQSAVVAAPAPKTPAPAAKKVAAAPTMSEIPEKLRGTFKTVDTNHCKGSGKANLVITKRSIMGNDFVCGGNYPLKISSIEEDDPIYNLTGGERSFSLVPTATGIKVSGHGDWNGEYKKE